MNVFFFVQRRKGFYGVVGFYLGLVALSVASATDASEGGSFPLPFSGTYQSLASEARELTSRGESAWVTIPQNVYLTLVKDQEIAELRLRIEVLDELGRVRYPINNRMWLRQVAGNQIEIYKLNDAAGQFERVGEGACTAGSCSYQYIILAYNNGAPYQQKYESTITWMPDDLGSGFSQSGSLSAEVTDEASGRKSWLVFKTWANRFEVMPGREPL